MDFKKFLVKRAVAWLILGLIGGGVAADWVRASASRKRYF